MLERIDVKTLDQKLYVPDRGPVDADHDERRECTTCGQAGRALEGCGDMWHCYTGPSGLHEGFVERGPTYTLAFFGESTASAGLCGAWSGRDID
jgi:hypothetical protein